MSKLNTHHKEFLERKKAYHADLQKRANLIRGLKKVENKKANSEKRQLARENKKLEKLRAGKDHLTIVFIVMLLVFGAAVVMFDYSNEDLVGKAYFVLENNVVQEKESVELELQANIAKVEVMRVTEPLLSASFDIRGNGNIFVTVENRNLFAGGATDGKKIELSNAIEIYCVNYPCDVPVTIRSDEESKVRLNNFAFETLARNEMAAAVSEQYYPRFCDDEIVEKSIASSNEAKVIENSYIVEFEEPSIAEHKANLEKEIENKEEQIKKIETDLKKPTYHAVASAMFGNNELDAIEEKKEELEQELPTKVEKYKKTFEASQKKAIDEVLNIVMQMSSSKFSTLSEVDVVEQRFSKVINAVVMNIDEETAEKLEKLPGVKAVHQNKIYSASLFDSTRVINADKVWEIEDINGEKITGKNVTVAIIDTGIDNIWQDFGDCGERGIFGGSNAVSGSSVDECASVREVLNEKSNDVNELTRQIIRASEGSGGCVGLRNDFESNLVSLLSERKHLLSELIEADPDSALRVQELPARVKAGQDTELFEERGEFKGELEVMHIDFFDDPEKTRFDHFLRKEDGKYKLFAGEDLPVLQSRTKVSVRGVSLDGKMAVDANEGPYNVIAAPPEPSVENLGVQQVLVIVADANGSAAPVTLDQARAILFDEGFGNVQDYYKKNSFNQTELAGIVIGKYDLGSTCKYEDMLDVALDKAEQNGIRVQDFSRIVLAVPTTDCISAGGLGTVGKRAFDRDSGNFNASVSWDFHFSLRVVGHELGHNFGANHASYFYCEDAKGEQVRYSFNCNVEKTEQDWYEYGDRHSIMGSGTSHHNGPHKYEFGWLSEDNVVNTKSGRYTLQALEENPGEDDIVMIRLPVTLDAGFYGTKDIFYTIEYRKPFDYGKDREEGVIVHMGRFREKYFSGRFTNIIDMAPNKYGEEILPIGESYIDEINGYKITTVNINEEGAVVDIEEIPKRLLNFSQPIIDVDFNDGKATNKGFKGLDGTIKGATPFNGSLLFNGNEDSLQFGKMASTFAEVSNEITVSVWVNVGQFGDRDEMQVFNIGSGVSLNIVKNGKIKLWVGNQKNEASADILLVESNKAVLPRRWHHIVAGNDGDYVYIYVDGNKVGEKTIQDLDLAMNWRPSVNLGGGFRELYNGDIDEFKLYARSLSEEEIVELFEDFEDSGGVVESKPCRIVDKYDFVECEKFKGNTCVEPNTPNSDLIDYHGHGTHVAGIVGADGLVKGVAPDAQLISYRVLNKEGKGSDAWIISAIERSIDPNEDGNFDDHWDIISLSLGVLRGNPDDAMSIAIDNAVGNGIVAVVAAGNAGTTKQTIDSPGTSRKAITVGGTDKCDRMYQRSSSGPVIWNNEIIMKPDVVAPAVQITSSSPDGYTSRNGTSMATPHVSGLAALLLQKNKDLEPDGVKFIIKSGVQDLGLDPAQQGAGRVDAVAVVNPSIVAVPDEDPVVFDQEFKGTKEIKLFNLREESTVVEFSAGKVYGLDGREYDVVSFPTDKVAVGNELIRIELEIDASSLDEGHYYGKAVLEFDRRKIGVPYSFTKRASVVDVNLKIEPKNYDFKIIINDTDELEYVVRNIGTTKAEDVVLEFYDNYNEIWTILIEPVEEVLYDGIGYRVESKLDGMTLNLSFQYEIDDEIFVEQFELDLRKDRPNFEFQHLLETGHLIEFNRIVNGNVPFIRLSNYYYSKQDVGDIEANQEVDVTIPWGTDLLEDHKLIAYVDAEDEVDYQDNYDRKQIQVVEDKPDLSFQEISFDEIYNREIFEVNKDYTLNLTLRNGGVRDSGSFVVNFIDMSIVKSVSVKEGKSRKDIIDGIEYKTSGVARQSIDPNRRDEADFVVEYLGDVEQFTLRRGEVKHLQTGLSILLDYVDENRVTINVGEARRDTFPIFNLAPEEWKKIIFDWKTDRNGRHHLIVDIDTDYDFNQNNNVRLIIADVIRDVPDLSLRLNNFEIENAIVGRTYDLNYTVYNEGFKYANNAKFEFIDLFNLRHGNAPMSVDELTEGAIWDSEGDYYVLAQQVDLPTEEQSQRTKKIVKFRVRYESDSGEVKEEFELRRNNVKQLQNGMFFGTEYYDDSSSDIGIYIAKGVKEEISAINISVEESRDFIIKWTPNTTGYPKLWAKISAEEDGNWEDNILERYPEVLEDAPLLHVQLESDNNRVQGSKLYIVREADTIDIEVENQGSVDAENVVLEVYASSDRILEEFVKIAEGESSGQGPGVKVINKIARRQLILSKEIDALKVGEILNEEIFVAFNETGDYQIEAFVKADNEAKEENSESRDFMSIRTVEDEAYLVGFMDAEHPQILNTKVPVKIFIENVMKHNAEDVVVELYERKVRNLSSPYGTKKSREDEEISSVKVATVSLDKISGNSKNVLVEFNWTPTEYFEYQLRAVINYTSNNSDKISTTRSFRNVETQVNQSDITIYFVDIDETLIVNKTERVYVYLHNRGLQDSKNGKLTFYVNDAKIGEKEVQLDSREAEDYRFEWNITEENDYKLKFVLNIEDDFEQRNNVVELDVVAGLIINTTYNITNGVGENIGRVLTGERRMFDRGSNGIFEMYTREENLNILDDKANGADATVFIYSLPVVEPKLKVVVEDTDLNRSEKGVFIRRVFANKINWDYKGVAFWAELEWKEGDMNVFYCSKYDFINKSCLDFWKVPKENKVDTDNELINVYIGWQKAEAFAFGLLDLDNDGIPDISDDDDDNDGITDDLDKVKGNASQIRTNINDLRLRIANSTNLSKKFNKTETITFVKSNKPRLEFIHNFSRGDLDISNFTIEERSDNLAGGILVRGVQLEENETKTVYIDDISNSNEVCIKDQEIESLSNITADCSGTNETVVFCPINNGSYSCEKMTIEGISLYKIGGLRNSGVQELAACVEQWDCGNWSACSSNKQTRTCTDAKQCGTITNKPVIDQSCGNTDGGSIGNNNNNQGGSGVVFRGGDVFNIGTLDIGTVKQLGLRVPDVIKFTINNKQYRLQLNTLYSGNAEISVKPTYHSVTMQKSSSVVLDMDDNGFNDLKVELNANSSRAYFKLEKLDENKVTQQGLNTLTTQRRNFTLTKDQVLVVARNITRVDRNVEDQTSFKGWALFFLSILVFFGVMMYVFKEEEKKRREKRRWKAERKAMEQGRATGKEAHHEVLEMFVRQLKDKDHSREKIVEELAGKGWHPRDIMHVIKVQERKQVYGNIDSLVEFIERSVNKGYTREHIAKAMYNKGWSKEVIVKAFKREKRLRRLIK
jgi:subtilisin family serine protease